jgi:hypothetical protein
MGKASKRGGARVNAGRKRTLSEMQEIAIGLECERLQSQIAYDTAVGHIAAKKLPSALAARIAKIKDPTDVEREALRASGSHRLIPRPQSVVEAHIKAGREVYGSRSRGYSEPLKRPKAKRDSILTAGIEFARESYGVLVTKTYIRHCWEKARGLQARIDAEIDSV